METGSAGLALWMCLIGRTSAKQSDGSQGVQRIDRPRRAVFPRIRVRRQRDDRAKRRRADDGGKLKRAAVERDRAGKLASAARGW
jgi:hypothetical protein